MIRNPVLPGFHPDPCLVCVDGDFFIATSTFEWHPGVALHHSRDLVHWRAIGHALTRPSQLDLRGLPDSAGVWAPALSHDGERFYLVYSVVRARTWPMLAVANYLVTATEAAGPWSEPVYLNGSGWDPSLFHDGDGRKWLVNMLLDARCGREPMGGIVLQEFDVGRQRLVGPRHHLGYGSALGAAEGPHLYRRGGWYYLLLAEGGTWKGHAATLFRARALVGPYEPCPHNPILTAADAPALPLQRAGHASLAHAPDGSSWLAFLCGRPTPNTTGCLLGRETALARVTWTPDEWLALEGGGHHPPLNVEPPKMPFQPLSVGGRDAERGARDEFDAATLGPEWQTLRAAADPSWLSLVQRPGWLSLRGRDPITSHIEPSVVARRVTSAAYVAETLMEFAPESHLQAAGLMMISDAQDNIGLFVTAGDEGGRILTLVQLTFGRRSEPLAEPIALPAAGAVMLRIELARSRLRFAHAIPKGDWHHLPCEVDVAFLADDHAGKQTFTGAFVGVGAVDRDRGLAWASFDWFHYEDRDDHELPHPEA